MSTDEPMIPYTIDRLTAELRRSFGWGVFYVDQPFPGLVFIEAIQHKDNVLLDTVAAYLRSLGYRAYQTEGPRQRILVTGVRADGD